MKKQNSQQIRLLRMRTEIVRILTESTLVLAAGGSVVSGDSNGPIGGCPSVLGRCQQF
jgi:hypothetical protein